MNKIYLPLLSFITMKPYIAVLLCLIFCQCHRDESVNPNGAASPSKTTDVYVTGEEMGPAGFYKAMLWKNGVPTALYDGINNGRACDVKVTGNNVFVVGYQPNSNAVNVAMLWKNSTPIPLRDGTINMIAKSVFILGDDVYIGGYSVLFPAEAGGVIKAQLQYWKNGILIPMSGTFPLPPDIYGCQIVVAGSDVYMNGSYRNENNILVARYWKNGTEINLSDGTADEYVTDMTLSGNDIYISGVRESGDKLRAKYWKNGTAVTLGDGSLNEAVTSIAVSGSTIVVGGYSSTTNLMIAKYWKNGSPAVLGNQLGQSYVRRVLIDGTSLYAAGFQMLPDLQGGIARYWKNNTPVDLTNGTRNALAWGIFVTGDGGKL